MNKKKIANLAPYGYITPITYPDVLQQLLCKVHC